MQATTANPSKFVSTPCGCESSFNSFLKKNKNKFLSLKLKI
jgi:hypothetical protein